MLYISIKLRYMYVSGFLLVQLQLFSAQVSVSKQDLLRALGSAQFMSGELVDSQPDETEEHQMPLETDGSCQQPQRFCLDDLFKKAGKKEHTLGILKVKFLGNALKDYQLIRTADEGPTFQSAENVMQSQASADTKRKFANVPTAIFFQKALLAMQEPRNN